MFYPDLSRFGVDTDRLKAERLARLQHCMKQHALDALLLTDWINLRYATNSVLMMGLRASAIQRFAIIPVTSLPIIYQRELARKNAAPIPRFDAFMFGMRPPVATRDFVAQASAGLRE